MVWDGRRNVKVLTLPSPMKQSMTPSQPDHSSETRVQFPTSVRLETAELTIPRQSLAGTHQGHRFAHTRALPFPSLAASPAREGRRVYRRQAKHLRLKQSWWNAGCPFNLLEIIRQKIMASHTHQFPGK